MTRIYVANQIQLLLKNKMIVLPDDEDITYFTSEGDHTGRSSNDHNNKKREHIISSMEYIDIDYMYVPTFFYLI